MFVGARSFTQVLAHWFDFPTIYPARRVFDHCGWVNHCGMQDQSIRSYVLHYAAHCLLRDELKNSVLYEKLPDALLQTIVKTYCGFNI